MVTYATGTTRQYAADRIPQTVAEWIRSNATATKPETAAEPQEAEKIPEKIESAKEEKAPSKPNNSDLNSENLPNNSEVKTKPEPQKVPKEKLPNNSVITTRQEARTQPATVATRTAPTAAEAVMYGVCIALMYIFEFLLGAVSVILIYVTGRIQYTWNHREEIAGAIQTAASRTAGAILTAVSWSAAEIIKAVAIQIYMYKIRYSSL